MKCWDNIRIWLVAAIFGGVLAVLGNSILYPSVSDRAPSKFVFPTTISLPGWQALASSPLINQTTEKLTKYISGRQYRYSQKDWFLDIEMRYLANTNGDIKGLIKNYKNIPNYTDKIVPILRQQEGIGFYSLFVHSERAYLSACINPRGGSTVTDEQFRNNRIIYDVRLRRLIPWLLGRAELRDMRCLWAHLSIPLKDYSAVENAYQTLEQAWVPWYQWWQYKLVGWVLPTLLSMI